MEPAIRERMKQTMVDVDLLLSRIQLSAGLVRNNIVTQEEFAEISKKYVNLIRKELGLTTNITNGKIILLNPNNRRPVFEESAPAEA